MGLPPIRSARDVHRLQRHSQCHRHGPGHSDGRLACAAGGTEIKLGDCPNTHFFLSFLILLPLRLFLFIIAPVLFSPKKFIWPKRHQKSPASQSFKPLFF
jgi:hypothetical protein